MAIKYCDWVNGDDTNGDGTASNPYKTIDKASTGLTGGDEVRVAKSPDPTNLTGTLSFTNGSSTVTGSGTSFTSELSAGDFIKGGDDYWYEAVSIDSDTQLTLYKEYAGDTQSGVSSQKLGITSTGEASSSSTAVQSVSSSGTSSSSKLKISGGWDLSTETQTGETWFRQMHSTFSNRYGYGLYASNKTYIEIEKCNFLRYYYGIYLNSLHHNTITNVTCNSNGYAGMYLSYGSDNTITTSVYNSNYYHGIWINRSFNNVITNVTCNSNGFEGIHSADNSNNIFSNLICNNNGKGIYFSRASNNTITIITCNNNTSGIGTGNGSNNIVNKFSGTGNSADIHIDSGNSYGDFPCIKCQHFGSAGTNKSFYEYGTTERDTTNARGGSGECLKYTPTSSTYYISQSFYFKADSGVSQTLSAYIMKDASFNGDVQGAIYFLGEKITGWTDITPSASGSYEQKSLTASSTDITEDGVLELRIKVRGSAGNVYVDDLSAS